MRRRPPCSGQVTAVSPQSSTPAADGARCSYCYPSSWCVFCARALWRLPYFNTFSCSLRVGTGRARRRLASVRSNLAAEESVSRIVSPVNPHVLHCSPPGRLRSPRMSHVIIDFPVSPSYRLPAPASCVGPTHIVSCGCAHLAPTDPVCDVISRCGRHCADAALLLLLPNSRTCYSSTSFRCLSPTTPPLLCLCSSHV